MITELILKFISLIIVPLIIGIILYQKTTTTPRASRAQGTLIYEAPYGNTLDVNLGRIQDPRIVIPLKTTHGFANTTFLLDSGAAVSTLPTKVAQDVGVNLATAKRIALQGFSGTPTFAYLDNITLRIGNNEFTIPATFTQSNSSASPYILGRKGLFDNFTILFDRENQTITLTKKI